MAQVVKTLNGFGLNNIAALSLTYFVGFTDLWLRKAHLKDDSAGINSKPPQLIKTTGLRKSTIQHRTFNCNLDKF